MSTGPTQRLRGSRVAVIDIETSGGSDARIIEIGVSLIDPFFEAPPVTVVDTLVGPPCPIDPYARRVHGIRAAQLEGCPSWAEIWPRVQQATANATWCAYNAGFEHRLLTAEIARHGLDGALPALPRWLDPLRLVRHLDQPPAGAKRYHTLEAACRRREIPHGHHRAAGDAACTAHLLHQLVIEAYRRDDVHPPPYATVADWLSWQGSLRTLRAPKATRAGPRHPWRGRR